VSNTKKPSTPPCPAAGDTIILTPDVSKRSSSFAHALVDRSCEGSFPFAVYDSGHDAMTFVLTFPEALEVQLVSVHHGFDSTFIWTAKSRHAANSHDYLMCIHFPVSGRTPMPEDLGRRFFVEPEFSTRLGEAQIWIYDMRHRQTLASWRDIETTPTPQAVYDIATQIAGALNAIHEDSHVLLRFNPETLLITDQGVRFLAVTSLDLPWNESCAQSHGLLENWFYTPPECRNFVRHPLTPPADVFVLGATLYFAICNAPPPICEALDFECPLGPRTFVPDFPMGWDEILLQALAPSPMRRLQSIDDLLTALGQALHDMHLRQDSAALLQYEAAVDTHIGIAKRLRYPVNQDAVFLRMSENGSRLLMVVGDGVSTSTYGSGDLASGFLVESAESAWHTHINIQGDIDPASAIHDIFKGCNEAICNYIKVHYGETQPTVSDSMGTTALALIIDNGAATLGAVGDSRAYLVRKEFMTCITRAHNLFTTAIINGLPPQYCAMHPHAGSLVHCLGFFDEHDNTCENLSVFYDLYTFKLLPEDNILLTTDGLLDYASHDIGDTEAIIAQTLLTVPDPALACLELILIANRGGGGDNIGVGILSVKAAT